MRLIPRLKMLIGMKTKTIQTFPNKKTAKMTVMTTKRIKRTTWRMTTKKIKRMTKRMTTNRIKRTTKRMMTKIETTTNMKTKTKTILKEMDTKSSRNLHLKKA